MTRNIFLVCAQIVDANGTFNQLSGYPKTFDSRSYSGEVDRALKRAKGEFHKTYGTMCDRDDRQLQTVVLMSADGFVIDTQHIGAIPADPEPEPEPEA